MRDTLSKLLPLAALLMLLPLAGIWLAGRPLAPYLHFPPLTFRISHAAFSWPVFFGLVLFVATACAPLLLCLWRQGPIQAPPRWGGAFPWWGAAGILLILLAWPLAWLRLEWFSSLQPYTFLPLWLGYILTVNGLSEKRAGTSLLSTNPRFFLALFPASALFWWFFEYLNRFAQNWHYVGIDDFSAAEYVLHATLSFSTVLPAVLATTEYLASFPRLSEPLRHCRPLRCPRPTLAGWLTLTAAGAGLAGIGLWPDFLFPLLWIAPLLIIVSEQSIKGEPTILSPAGGGDWRPLWLPPLAALICGFFWEMWNVGSLAHWEYSVPLVQRFHLFEMPLLGYAGYLPFGLECLAAADLVQRFLAPTRSHAVLDTLPAAFSDQTPGPR